MNAAKATPIHKLTATHIERVAPITMVVPRGASNQRYRAGDVITVTPDVITITVRHHRAEAAR